MVSVKRRETLRLARSTPSPKGPGLAGPKARFDTSSRAEGRRALLDHLRCFARYFEQRLKAVELAYQLVVIAHARGGQDARRPD